MVKQLEYSNIRIPDGVFTRQQLLEENAQAGMKATQMRHALEKLTASGRIIRVGHGKYSADKAKPTYIGNYSDKAILTAQIINNDMFWLDFRVWELSWLNEFLNHQLTPGYVFVETERDGTEFAFDLIAEHYHGEVLLRPTIDDLLRYGTDGTIVVKSLFSSPPPSGPETYHVGLEKIVVDMFTERLLRDLLPRGDYPEALHDMFTRYSVNQVSMMRYARRRGRENEIREFLRDKSSIKLYV